MRACRTASGARSLTTVTSAPGTASATCRSRLRASSTRTQDQPAGAGLAEVGPQAGQVAVGQPLVPRIVGGDRPALLDPGEIDQRVGDVRLAQQPCRLGGNGRLSDPDRPGDQQHRHPGGHGLTPGPVTVPVRASFDRVPRLGCHQPDGSGGGRPVPRVSRLRAKQPRVAVCLAEERAA